MNWKNVLLIFLFVDFAAFTGYAIVTEGVAGFLEMATSNAWTLQVTIDLVIALTFVLVWMIKDARTRGTSVVPFVLLTLCLGSIGPLAYLIRRELSTAGARRRVAAAA